MSQENIELARQVFEAVAQRDSSRLIELTEPEVEWRSFFAVGEEGGVYRGHTGIQRYVKDLDDAWELIHPDIEQGIGLGSVVLLVGQVQYRGRGSGVETAEPAGWVLKFRAGRVLSFRAFHEPEQALEAAGLPK
jgi:ketosteroid isomerase-like protein